MIVVSLEWNLSNFTSKSLQRQRLLQVNKEIDRKISLEKATRVCPEIRANSNLSWNLLLPVSSAVFLIDAPKPTVCIVVLVFSFSTRLCSCYVVLVCWGFIRRCFLLCFSLFFPRWSFAKPQISNLSWRNGSFLFTDVMCYLPEYLLFCV